MAEFSIIMELPRVNPIGIVEAPATYEASPRRLPMALRLVAVILLIAFTTVGTVATVVSMGKYCLTSYAAMPTAAPGSAEGTIGGGGLGQWASGSEQHDDTIPNAGGKQVRPEVSGT